MSRLQLALNVSNLDEAVAFYSAFFKTAPAKIRPGYANFAVSDPPLKLVLFENAQAPGTINHLGVEVFSSDEVVEATTYLKDQGFSTDVEMQTTCCHAVQDKVWVSGPDDSRWEVYTVLGDASDTDEVINDPSCCVSDATAVSVTAPACC